MSAGPSDDTVRTDLEDAVFRLEPGDQSTFDALEARIRAFQRERNPVLRAFGDVARHLPVSAFRLARVAAFPDDRTETVFRSSGTGGPGRSEHHVLRLAHYERTVVEGFRRAFGAGPCTIVGYLPAYAPDSSLVHMMRHLVTAVGDEGGAVFDDDPQRIVRIADSARSPVVVVGAAFGLLDLAEAGSVRLPEDAFVVETGGMKTHRRAVDRETLHDRLASGFGIPRSRVGSEYGMCELTSQAWSIPGARYTPPPWMRVEIVDPGQPNRRIPDGRIGLVAVTDLANIYSAVGILTEDTGRCVDGRFEVLGRATGAELRGCNLLLEGTI